MTRVNGKINPDTAALVVWAYDSGDHAKGDIVSQHKTIEAAQRKSNRSTFWQPVDIRDAESTVAPKKIGRPLRHGEKLKRLHALVTQKVFDTAMEVGHGELSRGARIMLEDYIARHRK